MRTGRHPVNRAVATFGTRKLQRQSGINHGGFDASQLLAPHDPLHRPVNILAHITAWQTSVF